MVQQRKKVKYTKKMVLEALEALGNIMKEKCTHSYYAAEDHRLIDSAKRNLEVLRNCYRQIRAGSNINMQLNAAAHKIGGIEGNRLQLISSGLSLTEWEDK